MDDTPHLSKEDLTKQIKARYVGKREASIQKFPLLVFSTLIVLLAGLLPACVSFKIPRKLPTPLPTLSLHSLAISPDNATNVTELARYGSGTLRDIRWAPDGQTVQLFTAVGIYDYSIPDFKQLNFHELPLGTEALTVSRDGGLVVSVVNIKEINYPDGSFDRWDTLRMWDVVTREPLWEQKTDVWRSDLAFSPDGNLLAVGGWKAQGDGGRVQVWDARLGKLVMQEEDDRTGPVDEVVFSPDGRLLGVAGRGDSHSQKATLLRIWDIPTQKLLYSMEGEGQAITFSADGKTILLGNERWDLTTGKALEPGGYQSEMTTVDSPDGRWKAYNAFMCEDSDEPLIPPRFFICVWSLDSNKLQWKTNTKWFPVSVLAFSPDSRKLITYGKDLDLQLWEVATGKLLAELAWNGDYFTDLAIHPTGRFAAWVDSHNRMQIWDLVQGKRFPAKAENAGSIAYSPAGLLAAGNHVNLILWDETGSKQILKLPGQGYPDDGLSFSPDGKLLVGVNNGSEVTVWDIPAGKKKASLVGHTSSVVSVDFSRYGTFFATASDDATIRLWDSKTLTCTRILKTGSGFSYYAFSVAISPDSQYVAGGTSDGKIWLWRTSSGELVRQFNKHTEGVGDLAFSPDGQLLASAGDDKHIILWNVSTGEALKDLMHHTSHLNTLAFTPDGRWLLSGSSDGTVRVWGSK